MEESKKEINKEEIEKEIENLAKQGFSPSKIGLILKEKGIYDVRKIFGKKLQQILKEKNLLLPIPEDLYFLIKKAVRIREHLKVHRKDMHSKRGLILTESKIHRLIKYYKRIGKLPKDWEYNPEEAKILIEKYSYKWERI